MILPESFVAVLLIALLGAVCWTIWPVTYQRTVERRFELYYLDFGLGAAIATILLGFTLGVFGGDITLVDNLIIVGKRDLGLAFVAGAVLNLGNMLLVAAMSTAGVSTALSMAAAAAISLTVARTAVAQKPASLALVAGSVLAAIVALALAAKVSAAVHAARQPPATAPARPGRKKPKRTGPWAAIVLASVGGLIIGGSLPLFDMARHGIIVLAAYGVGLLAGAGVVTSALFFDIWFMNLPVQGAAIGFRNWPGSARNHILGLLGGAMWGAGIVAFELASGAPASAGVEAAHIAALRHGSLVLAALVAWVGFSGRSGQSLGSRPLAAMSLALLAAAIGLGFLAG
jgi:glucose uptake protein